VAPVTDLARLGVGFVPEPGVTLTALHCQTTNEMVGIHWFANIFGIDIGVRENTLGNNDYQISGSYYEACNCEAICPCRRQNGVSTGLSTYGVCDFILSWHIKFGKAGDVDLDNRLVCMVGSYRDDEDGKPWTVIIYVDQDANEAQKQAIGEIFSGKLGGNMRFTQWIVNVIDVRSAAIELIHEPGHESIKISGLGNAAVVKNVDFDGVVTCGISGHDRPGQESVSSLEMRDDPFDWRYEERCGFATNFAYQS
jgi:hypothetical protein